MAEFTTDLWVIRSNNFKTASEYAAQMDWAISAWTWLPAYTINDGIQLFGRVS